MEHDPGTCTRLPRQRRADLRPRRRAAPRALPVVRRQRPLRRRARRAGARTRRTSGRRGTQQLKRSRSARRNRREHALLPVPPPRRGRRRLHARRGARRRPHHRRPRLDRARRVPQPALEGPGHQRQDRRDDRGEGDAGLAAATSGDFAGATPVDADQDRAGARPGPRPGRRLDRGHVHRHRRLAVRGGRRVRDRAPRDRRARPHLHAARHRLLPGRSRRATATAGEPGPRVRTPHASTNAQPEPRSGR